MFHSPIQLEVFPTDLQMRRIDLACNMRRFYRLSVQRDLFGGASLVREWGRIGFRGQMLIVNDFNVGKAVLTCNIDEVILLPALRNALTEWPLVSAPMAEALTGASRAAVQRNLAWMEARDLIREVTGQGRFRMWRALP